jgi:hypothetical protein
MHPRPSKYLVLSGWLCFELKKDSWKSEFIEFVRQVPTILGENPGYLNDHRTRFAMR